MTNVINFYVAGEESLPLEDSVNPLLPSGYDIVWSVLVLVVIAILFIKLVLPKFTEVLAHREDLIKGGIERAEAADREARAALEKYNAQLADARAQAAQIRDDAREKGKAIVEELKSEGAVEKQRIIDAGEKELLAQRERVVGELRKDIGRNAVDLAERLLEQQLSDDAKRAETIDSFLASLSTLTPADPAGK